MLNWEQQADRIDELEQLCALISEDATKREQQLREAVDIASLEFEERRLALTTALIKEKEKVIQLQMAFAKFEAFCKDPNAIKCLTR